MKATEFKNRIKEVKENLRGVVISFSSHRSIRPLMNLRAFGNEILKHETYGHSFSVGQVWTTNGIKSIQSFEEFVTLLKGGSVTAVRVNAYKDESANICDLMKSFGSLD